MKSGANPLLQRLIRDVQKSRTPGTAQKLACARRQEVAFQLTHVDGHLSDGLAGVHQVQNSLLATQGTDCADILYQAGVCRNMRYADELGPMAANQVGHGLHIDTAFHFVRCPHDSHAEASLERQKLYLTGCVVVARGEDGVTACKRNR